MHDDPHGERNVDFVRKNPHEIDIALSAGDLTNPMPYVTGAATTSFKGYYRLSATQDAAFLRTFIQYDGEGETPTPGDAPLAGMRRRR